MRNKGNKYELDLNTIYHAAIHCRCTKCGFHWEPTNNISKGKLHLSEGWNICKQCGDNNPWTNKYQFNNYL